MNFEPIVVLLLFSLFFAFMVVIVLFISFNGIGAPLSAKEGNINILNFYDASAIWVQLRVDDDLKFKGAMPPNTTLQYDWTEPRTVEYVISKTVDPTAPDSLIVSKIVNVTKDSLILVTINPDGSFFEQFSSRLDISD